MAGRQAHPTTVRSPSRARRVSRAAILAAAALLLAGCRSRELKVSGEITVAAPLVSRMPRDNSTLFIVIKNLGGVPVAVKRIVNPQFPAVFRLTDQDLIVPGSKPSDPLTIEVEMNSHGNAGSPARGDLSGVYPDEIALHQSRVHLVIDRIVSEKGSFQVTARGGWRRRPATQNVPWADQFKN